MQGECTAGPAADGAHKHLVQDEHRAWYERSEGLKSSLGIPDTSRVILQRSQEFLFGIPGGSLEVCFWGGVAQAFLHRVVFCLQEAAGTCHAQEFLFWDQYRVSLSSTPSASSI